ncbi:unnamed protein product [Prunus armeniaca]
MEKKEKCGLTYTQCNLCFWGLIVDTIDSRVSIVHDPGHRRVYIESSEDGHWEVIDTEEYILLDLVCSRWSAKGGQITSGDMVRPDNYKIKISSVLAACAHLGAFDPGIWAHGYLRRSCLASNVVETTGVKPNHVTFVGLLSACAHSGLAEKGRWCFRVMKRVYLIEPQLYHYASMVDMLSRAGLICL